MIFLRKLLILLLVFMLLFLRFFVLIVSRFTFFCVVILFVTIVMHLTQLLHYDLLSGHFIYFWLLKGYRTVSSLDKAVSFLSYFFWHGFLALYEFAIYVVFIILQHSVYRFDVFEGDKAKAARLVVSVSHNGALFNSTIDREVADQLLFGSHWVNTANKDFLDITDARVFVARVISLIVGG